MKSEAKVRITIEADHQPHDESVQHTLSQWFTVELNGTDSRQTAEQRTLSALRSLLSIASKQRVDNRQDAETDVQRGQNGSPSRRQSDRNGDSTQGQQRRGQPASAAQIRAIHAITKRAGMNLVDYMGERYDGQDVNQLTMRQASQLIDELKADLVGQSA